MSFEIIDFHTHPFKTDENSICQYPQYCAHTPAEIKAEMNGFGITKICGAVIKPFDKNNFDWESTKSLNDLGLEIWEELGDFFVPGFLVHPKYVKESLEEIERMHKKGVKIIGELVPYYHGWSGYDLPELYEILELAEQYGMILNLHTMYDDSLDRLVQSHPNLTIVAAHPNDGAMFNRHMERMKMSENYYIDISATGLFRHGQMRHLIDTVGVDRILFGTDYPTCAPDLFLGNILLNTGITDAEREAILAGNAKRLLEL